MDTPNGKQVVSGTHIQPKNAAAIPGGVLLFSLVIFNGSVSDQTIAITAKGERNIQPFGL
jgi:hypothetical protein